MHLELPEDVAARGDRAMAPIVPLASDRAPGRASGRDRPRGRDDPGGQAPADHDRRRPATARAWSTRCRASCAARGMPFFNTQMGKGAVTGGSNLYMGTAALVGARLCPPGDRPRRPDHLDRPRHDREAALHHGRRGGPKVIHIGFTSANVEQVFFPHAEVVGDIGAEPLAAGRPAGAASSIPIRRSWRCGRKSSRGSTTAPRRTASR